MSQKPLHFYRSSYRDEPIFDELIERHGNNLQDLDADEKISLAIDLLTALLSGPLPTDIGLNQQIQALTPGGRLELVRALVEQLRN